ncbi:hypothetical protein D9M68_915840 [compost metagenome]
MHRNISIVDFISSVARRIRSTAFTSSADRSLCSSSSSAPVITVMGVRNSWLAEPVKSRSRTTNALMRSSVFSMAPARTPTSSLPNRLDSMSL